MYRSCLIFINGGMFEPNENECIMLVNTRNNILYNNPHTIKHSRKHNVEIYLEAAFLYITGHVIIFFLLNHAFSGP